MYLILIDVHSKWVEVQIMTSAASSVAIEKMHFKFATFGIPETLVTIMELTLPVPNLKSFWSQMEYAIPKQLYTTQHQMTSPKELCKHSNLA